MYHRNCYLWICKVEVCDDKAKPAGGTVQSTLMFVGLVTKIMPVFLTLLTDH